MRSLVWTLSGIAAIGAVAHAHGCGSGHSCTAIGCTDGATVWIPALPGGSTLTLCLNQVCSAVTVPSGASGTTPSVTFPAPLCATFGVYDSQRDVVDVRPCSGSFQQGDVYRIQGVGLDGAGLVDHTESVTYSVHMPNGAECGPTCKNVTIALTPPPP